MRSRLDLDVYGINLFPQSLTSPPGCRKNAQDASKLAFMLDISRARLIHLRVWLIHTQRHASIPGRVILAITIWRFPPQKMAISLEPSLGEGLSQRRAEGPRQRVRVDRAASSWDLFPAPKLFYLTHLLAHSFQDPLNGFPGPAGDLLAKRFLEPIKKIGCFCARQVQEAANGVVVDSQDGISPVFNFVRKY
jgi:hypothetical protein